MLSGTMTWFPHFEQGTCTLIGLDLPGRDVNCNRAGHHPAIPMGIV